MLHIIQIKERAEKVEYKAYVEGTMDIAKAEKFVAELNKMKKDLEKLQESKVIVVQNGALTMATQVDELIALIPTKVPEK